MDGPKYSTFEKADYLSSPLFKSDSVQLLLALRTRTVEGIRNDFRGMYPDNKCPMACEVDDTLQHMLECTVLRQHHLSDNISASDIKFSDIFSQDTRKQKQVTELYGQLIEIRTKLINSEPDLAGPVQCL